jgi:hypothetical protein
MEAIEVYFWKGQHFFFFELEIKVNPRGVYKGRYTEQNLPLLHLEDGTSSHKEEGEVTFN